VKFAALPRRLLSLNWLRRRPEDRAALGRRGERAAARFLRRRGFRVLIRDYHCPFAQIDMIASQGEWIVFIEVKTRRTEENVLSREDVSPTQRERIERAAKYFVHAHQVTNRPVRFDVLRVIWPVRGNPKIEHIEDAWQAQLT